jgi:uncharacterized protein with FMN-binding domain
MRRVLIGAGGAIAGAVTVLASHVLTGQGLAPGAVHDLTAAPGGGAPSVSPTEIRRPPTYGTATGPRIETDYGPVQVKVTVKAGAIVDIQTLIMPSFHERSRWIVANLVPRLRQRVLTAQSADVDVLSEATFTSGGYLSSLQAALDQLS